MTDPLATLSQAALNYAKSQGWTPPAPTPLPLPALTRSGSALKVSGKVWHGSGANAYWLGLDDNDGPLALPSHTKIDNALTGMKAMGINLIRSHTIGISAGTPLSFSSAPGVYVDNNLDSADWAVYRAGQLGIRLMVPLTDNWNYSHAGKWVFVHWAFQQNPAGIVDTPGCIKDDVNERIFFAANPAGFRVRALFKDYISRWLNHVNPYTKLAYKDDPTIAIVETGNEIYFAAQLGTNEWTQDICSYVKSIAPKKLTADGSAGSGTSVAAMPGLTAAACDIVGSHYYPADSNWQPVGFTATSPHFPAGNAIGQLAADTAAARAAGRAFIVGEYPWTRSDVSTFWAAVEKNPTVTGDCFWSMIANTDGGQPEVHGNTGFGGDDYPLHWPYASVQEQQYAPGLVAHVCAITGQTPL